MTLSCPAPTCAAAVADEAEGRAPASSGPRPGPNSLAPMVGIVIVNWNGWEDTLRCLASLALLQYPRWKAIVVDNASTDESLSRLRPFRGTIELLESAVNTGWAGGNNIGMRRAFELGCDYVWLLNNDAVATTHALAELVQAARVNPQAAFIGSLIDHDPPGDTYQFAGTRTDPESGVPEGIHDAPRQEGEVSGELIKTGYVMGCSLLASSSAIGRIGYIDERYFLNFDETDWCRRAEAQGLQCLLVPRPLVRHKSSASIGGSGRPLHRYFMIRNRLLFARTHCTPRQRLYAWKMTFWEIARFARMEGHPHWLVACLRRDTPLIRTALIAVRDFLTGRLGDCPATVRTLHDSTRTRPGVAMQPPPAELVDQRV